MWELLGVVGVLLLFHIYYVKTALDETLHFLKFITAFIAQCALLYLFILSQQIRNITLCPGYERRGRGLFYYYFEKFSMNIYISQQLVFLEPENMQDWLHGSLYLKHYWKSGRITLAFQSFLICGFL